MRTISIHALREEGDCSSLVEQSGVKTFLSTPSARRATLSMSNSQPTTGNFYPRPPRGGRQFASYARGAYPLFLSTPSARRATLLAEIVKPVELISIHALREEGDLSLFSASCCRPLFLSTPSARRATLAFSIHPTHGIQFLSTPSARRATRGSNDTVHGGVFLSTPSARRATLPASTVAVTLLISIHALREEGDTSSEKQS